MILDQFMSKCSICFENDTAIELSECNDQFCISCLERYILTILQDCWGIRQIQITCPVCRVPMSGEDWQTWIKDDIYDLYLSLSNRDRRLKRTCLSCDHEQTLSGQEYNLDYDNIESNLMTESIYKDINEDASFWSPKDSNHKHSPSPSPSQTSNNQIENENEQEDDEELKDSSEIEIENDNKEDNDNDNEIKLASPSPLNFPSHSHSHFRSSHSNFNSLFQKEIIPSPSPAPPSLYPLMLQETMEELDGIINDETRDKLMKFLCDKELTKFISELKGVFSSSFKPINNSVDNLELNEMRAIIRLGRMCLQRSNPYSDQYCPLQWQWLQFCRYSYCDDCNMLMCMKCGEIGWHRGITCVEAIRKELKYRQYAFPTTTNEDGTERPSLVDEIRYKLDNCKACPRCCTFIEREADSCNEMKCFYCGLKYCWECEDEWTSECGLYRCNKVTILPSPSSSSTHSNSIRRARSIEMDKEMVAIMNNSSLLSFQKISENTITDTFSPSPFTSSFPFPSPFSIRRLSRGPEAGVPDVTKLPVSSLNNDNLIDSINASSFTSTEDESASESTSENNDQDDDDVNNNQDE